MFINLYLYPLIIFLGILLGLNTSAFKRKVLIFIYCSILILQTTFRSLSVGSDTKNYYWMFMEVIGESWNKVWISFLNRYFYKIGDEDIGYLLFQKLVSLFTDSWFLFVFLANLIFFIPFGILIYRYCTKIIEIVFAFILYISLFHIISLSGGRQLYAIGLSIAGFLYLDKKKYVKSLIFIGIGMLFHFSCLLAVIPLLISRLNAKSLKIIHLITLFLVPVVILSANNIILFMGDSIGMDRYSRYGTQESVGGVWTFTSILVVTSIFCYISLKKNYLAQDKTVLNLYTMLPLFTFFGPLIYSNGSMIRISIYFHIFLVVLIPLAVNKFFNYKDRMFVYVILIVFLIFLSIRDGGLVYYFYWQQPHLFKN